MDCGFSFDTDQVAASWQVGVGDGDDGIICLRRTKVEGSKHRDPRGGRDGRDGRNHRASDVSTPANPESLGERMANSPSTRVAPSAQESKSKGQLNPRCTASCSWPPRCHATRFGKGDFK